MVGYGISIEVTGLIFTLGSFTYALSLPFINMIPNTVDKRSTLTFGLLLSSVSLIVIGPCPYFLPDTPFFVCLGLALQGSAAAFALIPCMPEMIKGATKLYPESKEELTDRVSGILSASFAIGSLIGPPIGGYLTQYYGFSYGSTLYGVTQFGYFLLYLTVGGGLMAFRTCFGSRRYSSMEDKSDLADRLSVSTNESMENAKAVGIEISNMGTNDGSNERYQLYNDRMSIASVSTVDSLSPNSIASVGI